MNSFGSNEVRRLRLRDMISAKIAVLERYKLKGLPSEAFVPRSMAEFRKWEDLTLNIGRISSPNPLNRKASPRNIDLIDDVERLLAYFNRIKVQKRVKRPAIEERTAGLEQECKDKQRKIDGLVSKVHELRASALALEADVQAKDSEIARLKRDLSAMRRRFPKSGSSLLSSVD